MVYELYPKVKETAFFRVQGNPVTNLTIKMGRRKGFVLRRDVDGTLYFRCPKCLNKAIIKYAGNRPIDIYCPQCERDSH